MATHGGKRAGAGRKPSPPIQPLTTFETKAQPAMVEVRIADPLAYLSEVMTTSPDERMRIEAENRREAMRLAAKERGEDKKVQATLIKETLKPKG